MISRSLNNENDSEVFRGEHRWKVILSETRGDAFKKNLR